MKITNVRVNKIDNGRCKGVAQVVLDDCFVIKNIRIIEGDYGLFVAFPSRPTAEGQYTDVCHPINQETRDMFSNAIIEEYNKINGVENNGEQE